jgi:hypothetical protein
MNTVDGLVRRLYCAGNRHTLPGLSMSVAGWSGDGF